MPDNDDLIIGTLDFINKTIDNVIHRLEKLEKRDEFYLGLIENAVYPLLQRIEKLEEHKKLHHPLQIDENRKISRRVDDLEKDKMDMKMKFKELENRIVKLESHAYSDGDLSAIHGQLRNIEKNDQFDNHRIDQLEKKFIELEKIIDLHHPQNLISSD
jgi:hypothetical protein